MVASKAAVAFLLLGLVASAHGILPTALNCADGFIRIGVEEITSRFVPCVGGASDGCCRNLNNLFKLGGSSRTAGCLCNDLLLDEIVNEVVSNELAAAVGFDRNRLEEIFQDCGTSFFGGIGPAWCPPKSQRIDFDQDYITDLQQAQSDAPNAFEIVGNTALVKRSFRERLFFG